MLIPRTRTQPNTTERKIYFYRWRCGYTPEENDTFDPATVAEQIQRLGFATRARYLELDDGNDLCLWPEDPPNALHMRLGMIRRTGLPQVEDVGEISPLTIGETQGLVEQIHLVFFPNRIVGAEFNFYAPRISRLTTYFADKLEFGHPPITFEMLLRQDIREQLARMQAVRVLRLRVHRAHIGLLPDEDTDIRFALEAAARVSEADEIELVLRPRPHSRHTLLESVRAFVRRFAPRPEAREAADVFRVQALDAATERFEWTDLLSDKLVVTRRVPVQDRRHRGIESAAMYGIIEQVYGELRAELERAAGVGP